MGRCGHPARVPGASAAGQGGRDRLCLLITNGLQYTVRVNESNPGLANPMLEQFGGPQGELAAACRYFTQALGEDDAGRKDMLFDIATDELSHLEVIGNIVVMLNKGAKGRGELYRSITADLRSNIAAKARATPSEARH